MTADDAESPPPALIAGVGETLGAALAREFARERPVALLSRTEDTVDALAADRRDDGHDAVAVTGDVTDAESVAAAAARPRALSRVSTGSGPSPGSACPGSPAGTPRVRPAG